MTKNTKDCHLNDIGNNNLSLDGLRVLVVDDDADSRLLLSFILECVDVQVMMATSALEALEVIQEFKPNLLISDIAMPDVDGYSFIRKIRTFEPPLGTIPAIAVTAVDTEEGREFAFLCGFQSYFIKPVDPIDLTTEIARLLETPLYM